ncbi:glycosyltransferase family 4 protein [bacterium]|nr:glycosyltransferase family 4 protein [bacterium]
MDDAGAQAPRIGIDASSVVGQRTGIGHATANLLSALAGIWPEDWPPARVWVNSPHHGIPRHDPWVRANKFKIKRTRIPGRLLLRSWQRLHWPPIERLLGAADLVHAPASYIPPVQRARRVVTVHDVYFNHAPQDVDAYGGGYFLQTFPKGLPAVDHIISVSQFTRDELLRFYELDPDRISVIHSGVDRQRFSSEASSDDDKALERFGIEQPYILCVATLEPRKNLPALVEGFARMMQILKAARQHPPRLVIAGPPGWSTTSMDKLVTDNELRRMIKWTGYVPDEVLPALYRKAFALIFPSVYEGFGMPVLEAMACGCPVVMSNAGSLPEIGGDCATYFNPRSSDSIARSLAKFMIDPHLRSYMRASGLNHVKKFTWESTARATLDVYRRVLTPSESKLVGTGQ